jgi:hypothetical protein
MTENITVRTLEDLIAQAPDLGAPIRILTEAGASFGQVAEAMGMFSNVDLSSITSERVDMHVGYRLTTPPEARILIRERMFSDNRIVMDKTAQGWKIAVNCDQKAGVWFVALVHLIFKIKDQDCAKQGGREHRGRHDLVVQTIDEYVSGFIGLLATSVASAK